MKDTLKTQLSTLTLVQESFFDKVIELSEKCICDDVLESLLEHDNLTEVDLGIGTLKILYEEGELKFRFIPSAKLREGLVTTIKEKRSPIEVLVDDTLKEKLVNVYKDLL